MQVKILDREKFSQTAINNIILVNQHICKHRPEIYNVNRKLLNDIFLNVNKHNEISDKRKRIVKKASHLFAGIIFYQPFTNGNKTTAETIMKYFLNINEYQLPMQSEEESQNIINLEVGISPLNLFEDQYDLAFEMAYDYLVRNIEDL